MSATIHPVADVFPREFATGTVSTMMISVINSNQAATAKLATNDEFVFELGSPWGQTLSIVSPLVTVSSVSGNLNASDFSITGSPSRRSVRVRFTGAPCTFPPGEGFGLEIRFTAPATASFGTVIASNLVGRGRLDPITPTFTTVAFIGTGSEGGSTGGATNVKGGTVNVAGGRTNVNGGSINIANGNTTVSGGTTTVVDGDTTVIDGNTTVTGGTTNVAGGSVTTGAGTVVNIGPGTVVNLPADSSRSEGGVSGPNFLQIAAARWYEAAALQRITLPGPAGGLCFDGRSVWAAISGGDRLVQIETTTGRVTEVTLIGWPNLQFPDPVAAMVYDGEKFWIAGPNGSGLVVQRDGGIQNVQLPPCERGAMVFDGTSVWLGFGGTLTRIDAAQPTVMSVIGSVTYVAGMAFDGTSLWICGRGGAAGSGQLVSCNPGNLQTGIPQALAFDPSAIAYDGSHLWLADYQNHAVRKWSCDAVTGICTLVGSYSVGFVPWNLLFDGSSIWVANRSSQNVTKLRAIDGAVIGTYAPNSAPTAMIFDGINVWVASGVDGTMCRL